MAEIDVVRHVVSDPSGVALLLAGPTARDLWPVGEARFGAPQRTGLGFVIEVHAGTAGGELHGRVLIAPDGTETRSTELRLVATVDGPAARRLSEAGAGFVEALAETARARSSAA
jgi:hypothetical protein